MKQYLVSTKIIDWQHPTIMQLADELSTGKGNKVEIAKACFQWVRNNIKHSHDYKMNPVTCCASEVLKYKTGYCYAKSHLLAALLRANSIPAGFCYQRLSVFDNGAPYCLHGFNGVYLSQYGWYRCDARGNKKSINAQFTPPQEKLAYQLNFAEEFDCKQVFAQPLDVVIKALNNCNSWDNLLNNLPDAEKIALNNYR